MEKKGIAMGKGGSPALPPRLSQLQLLFSLNDDSCGVASHSHCVFMVFCARGISTHFHAQITSAGRWVATSHCGVSFCFWFFTFHKQGWCNVSMLMVTTPFSLDSGCATSHRGETNAKSLWGEPPSDVSFHGSDMVVRRGQRYSMRASHAHFLFV